MTIDELNEKVNLIVNSQRRLFKIIRLQQAIIDDLPNLSIEEKPDCTYDLIDLENDLVIVNYKAYPA